ncbi:MAG: IPT/TIG domain-containing protein, partial [Taibaiella sp.]|nr:IPT/TIG domain-containing protein [Taibaiella sp.]
MLYLTPPTATSKTVTITGFTIPAGASFYIKWTYTGTGGSTNAQAIGIDNIVVTPAFDAPTVTSVSPNVANPGTTITITGTNFNTTAANNIVYFGATQATVSSASSTSLTVTSPVGATYARLSVLNTGISLTGFQQFAYLPKFDNSAYIAGILNFDAKV